MLPGSCNNIAHDIGGGWKGGVWEMRDGTTPDPIGRLSMVGVEKGRQGNGKGESTVDFVTNAWNNPLNLPTADARGQGTCPKQRSKTDKKTEKKYYCSYFSYTLASNLAIELRLFVICDPSSP